MVDDPFSAWQVGEQHPDSNPAVQGVLFDLDGVLAQTEPLKAEAHLRALAHCGGQASLETYAGLMGRAHAEVRAGLARSAGVTVDAQIYTQAYRQALAGLMETRLELTPGARELAGRLVEKGLRLAVVSSSSAAVIARVLESGGLSRFFEARVSADEVERKKPDPQPYRLALERLGLEPGQALAVEDSPAGLQSALQAGLRVIILRHALNQQQDFSAALAVVDGLNEIERFAKLEARL